MGRTTVVLGLASAAMDRGDRVLVVDADPSAGSTRALGVEPEGVVYGTWEVLANGQRGAAAEAIVSSGWDPSIELLPARELDAGARGTDSPVAGCPVADFSVANCRSTFDRVLAGVRGRYELILVDCPSGTGLTERVLAGSDLALVVTDASDPTRAVLSVADLIDSVWLEHNDRLDFAGLIVNRVSGRFPESRHTYELLARMVGRSSIWWPGVPDAWVLGAAQELQRPVHTFGTEAASVRGCFDLHYQKLRGQRSSASGRHG